MAPELPETHLAMGDALLESDQPHALAEAEYRSALGLKDSSAGHIRLAEILRLDGKIPDALGV